MPNSESVHLHIGTNCWRIRVIYNVSVITSVVKDQDSAGYWKYNPCWAVRNITTGICLMSWDTCMMHPISAIQTLRRSGSRGWTLWYAYRHLVRLVHIKVFLMGSARSILFITSQLVSLHPTFDLLIIFDNSSIATYIPVPRTAQQFSTCHKFSGGNWSNSSTEISSCLSIASGKSCLFARTRIGTYGQIR